MMHALPHETSQSTSNGEADGCGWFVGVDIGGTFTDLAAVNSGSGELVTAKALTTPSDPAEGILEVLALARDQVALAVDDVTDFVHATTLAINTVIERKGARVGLVATAGFTDVLEIAHGDRYDLYDLQILFREPLVDRSLRIGVTERVTAGGEVLVPLAEGTGRAVAQALIERDVESVAVCLLHSYKNAMHERQLMDEMIEVMSSIPVTVSAELAPIIREYERTLVTVVNAYVAPKLTSYLSRLTDVLAERGYKGRAQIMRSDGGWFSAIEASRYPVRILESGPAAGALAAATIATQAAAPQAVAFDMGGTTAKACLVTDGEPATADELEIARLSRADRGSGLPIRLPSVDLIEIGAGGGSIASIGPLGLLQVGPESSGAVPGPASYGRGGDRPTVTDADLLLGYLNPNYFAGGSLALDVDAAVKAISIALVETGAFEDVTAAAWGIHDLVNENMSRATRLHCVEHGVHPSAVVIVATGGAGPLHAVGLMGKLGARRVYCPPNVGVASALGLLQAPRAEERTVTDISLLDELSASAVEDRLQVIAARLDETSDLPADAEVRRHLNMRLQGQGYDVRVPLPPKVSALEEVTEAFRNEYARLFGRLPPVAARPEVVNWTVRKTHARKVMQTPRAFRGSRLRGKATAGFRKAYWGPAIGWQEAEVYRRAMLVAGQEIDGPVLIEEPTSTIIVGPSQRAVIDEYLNVCVEWA